MKTSEMNADQRRWFTAAEKGDIKALRALMSKGLDPKIRDVGGQNALHRAAWRGRGPAVALLVDACSHVSVDHSGRCALALAACGGHADLVGMLLAWHSAKKFDGLVWQALFEACEGGRVEIAKMLAAHPQAMRRQPSAASGNRGSCFCREPLFVWDRQTLAMAAARSGSSEMFRLGLEWGASNLSGVDRQGKTVLMHAAGVGGPKILKMALRDGAGDPAAVDKEGKDLLLHAAGSGSVEAVKMAAKICPPGRRCRKGRGGMSYAAGSGSARSVKWFAQHAELDFEGDETMTTPLHYASGRRGSVEAMKALVDLGRPISPVNIYGRTPLDMSTRASGDEPLKMLLSLGADPNAVDECGLNTLMVACAEHGEDKVRFLMALVDKERSDAKGNQALHIAADCGFLAAVKMLADEKGASRGNKDGQTPLIMAAKNKYCWQEVEELVKHGSLDAADNVGDTALIVAAGVGSLDAVRALLAAGAAIEPVNLSGERALDRALAGEHAACAEAIGKALKSAKAAAKERA